MARSRLKILYGSLRELSPNLPEIKSKLEGKILMLDGASIHSSKHTTDWLATHGIRTLVGWPAHSPDLNPIENWWSLMSRGIAPYTQDDLSASDDNRDKLWELMKIEARMTTDEVVRKLVMSKQTTREKKSDRQVIRVDVHHHGRGLKAVHCKDVAAEPWP